MSYTLLLEKAAEKELRNLPAPILRRIDKRLMALYDEPRPRGVVKLKGKEGEGWRVKAEVLFGMVKSLTEQPRLPRPDFADSLRLPIPSVHTASRMSLRIGTSGLAMTVDGKE